MTMGCNNNNILEYAVLRVGGLYASSAACWEHILCRLQDSVAMGQHPIVVCSGLAGVFESLGAIVEAPGKRLHHLRSIWDKHDRLCDALGLNIISTIGEEWSSLEDLVLRYRSGTDMQSRVLASAEQMSSRIGAAWLTEQGLRTRRVDASALLARSDRPEKGAATITQRTIQSPVYGDSNLLDTSDAALHLISKFGAQSIDFESVSPQWHMQHTAEILHAALPSKSPRCGTLQKHFAASQSAVASP